jgi:hypothetical protein
MATPILGGSSGWLGRMALLVGVGLCALGAGPAGAAPAGGATPVTARVRAVGTILGAAPDPVRLSEFLASPARDWNGDGVADARADEWVEVVNAGGSVADLSEYRIADGDSTIRIALTGALLPGAYAMVTGQDALDWQHAVGRSATGLSLNNAGDTVRLFHIVGADTTEVDAKTYNSIEGGSDRSAGRLDPLLDSSWALFDGLNPYTGSGDPRGTGCLPTPAFANQCTTGVRRNTTWGRIKAMYR